MKGGEERVRGRITHISESGVAGFEILLRPGETSAERNLRTDDAVAAVEVVLPVVHVH